MRKIIFEIFLVKKYFSKNIFVKIFSKNIFVKIFSKNIFVKIFFEFFVKNVHCGGAYSSERGQPPYKLRGRQKVFLKIHF